MIRYFTGTSGSVDPYTRFLIRVKTLEPLVRLVAMQIHNSARVTNLEACGMKFSLQGEGKMRNLPGTMLNLRLRVILLGTNYSGMNANIHLPRLPMTWKETWFESDKDIWVKYVLSFRIHTTEVSRLQQLTDWVPSQLSLVLQKVCEKHLKMSQLCLITTKGSKSFGTRCLDMFHEATIHNGQLPDSTNY